jgi:hypothetical protein
VKRLALVFALIASTSLSCKLNDYCLECGRGDANLGDSTGGGDGDGAGSDSGTCVPTGDEICDGKDNDCDGLIDEGVLPMVGQLCANQMGECAGGVYQCTPTYHCSTTVNQPCSGPTDQSCPSGETCKPDDKSTDSLTCSKSPSPETCDGKDNNCNGIIDETDPGGGGKCANGPTGGACVQGINHCTGPCVNQPDGCTGTDSVSCIGYIGPTPEQCDYVDNDCDGNIDEDLTSLGSCGTSNVGECKFGALQCVDNSATMTANLVCVGAVGPQPEICNNKDDDCDGMIDEDFNLNTDPLHCGSCTNVCGAGLTNGGNANWACTSGVCVIASCKAGYHNNNGDPTDGCEFGACFPSNSGIEVCDGVDNDCDGVIDEQAGIGSAPAICSQLGECSGTVASCPCMNTPDTGCLGGTCVTSCAMPAGWECNYQLMNTMLGRAISLDVNGNIVPETLCDGKDNDCNGIIDDNQPPMAHDDCYECKANPATACLGLSDTTTCPAGDSCVVNLTSCPFTPPACTNGQTGICRTNGVYQCDNSSPPASLNGPAVCTAPAGITPGSVAETCNNLDDDCDGIVDEGANTGNLPGQNWIDIGNGRQMMQFEASRPDASATTSGAVNATTCSQAGVLPWTDVTYPQALAACQAIGATLCTESTWHRVCSAVVSQAVPFAINNAATSGTLIEAEEYTGIAFATSGGTTRSWVEDETSGFSGISDLVAQPAGNVTIANANGSAPRLDYTMSFPAAGTYRVFLHMFANTNNGGNFFSAYAGLGVAAAAAPTLTYKNTAATTWQWIAPASGFAVAGASTRVLSLYMGDGGVKVDAIFVTTSAGTPTFPANAPPGLKWAMTGPGYTSGECNDVNLGVNGPVVAGSLASCYANMGGTNHAFDLSGNIKEWTLAHQPGQNPIRGGAFNNDPNGISCPLDFTLADDTFFFPDVGFRCCR